MKYEQILVGLAKREQHPDRQLRLWTLGMDTTGNGKSTKLLKHQAQRHWHKQKTYLLLMKQAQI